MRPGHQSHSIASHESTPLSSGERPKSAGRLAGEAWLSRESDALVAVSQSEADTIVTRLGGMPGRIKVVPPRVNSTLFHLRLAVPCLAVPSSSHDYVLVAGRVHPLKGLDLAIEAIAAVPVTLKPHLVIAGDSSSDFAAYPEELTLLRGPAQHGARRPLRRSAIQGRPGSPYSKRTRGSRPFAFRNLWTHGSRGRRERCSCDRGGIRRPAGGRDRRAYG